MLRKITTGNLFVPPLSLSVMFLQMLRFDLNIDVFAARPFRYSSVVFIEVLAFRG